MRICNFEDSLDAFIATLDKLSENMYLYFTNESGNTFLHALCQRNL